tara:strand:- start:109 stop:300 length:192 start_codon:yes stop_codon:yes gene_type:complete
MTYKEKEDAKAVFKKEVKKVYGLFNRTLNLIKEVHIAKYTQEEYRLIVHDIYLAVLEDEQKNS